MSRLDRLELVVRHLTDRVLGEDYTFDAIAEQEAAEQGVTYTPPAPAVPDVSEALAPLIERLAALELRPVSQDAPDLSPILEAISDLSQRIAALEQDTRLETIGKHLITQERYIQEIIQALSGGGGEYGRVIDGILENGVSKNDSGLRKAG